MSDSVESQIRQALIFRLYEITTLNGYVNDIGDVYDDFPEDPGSITNFPSVAFLPGYDSRTNFDNEMLYVTARVTLVAFVDPGGSVVIDTGTIKQDIQRLLGAYPDLPGDGSGPTCELAIYSSSEPFGRVLDLPGAGNLRGTKIMIEVRYQQELADPTVG